VLSPSSSRFPSREKAALQQTTRSLFVLFHFLVLLSLLLLLSVSSCLSFPRPTPLFIACSFYLATLFLPKSIMKPVAVAVLVALGFCWVVNAQCDSAGLDFSDGATLYINPASPEPFSFQSTFISKSDLFSFSGPRSALRLIGRYRLPGDELGRSRHAVSRRHDLHLLCRSRSKQHRRIDVVWPQNRNAFFH
jgi:hypothetical protein